MLKKYGDQRFIGASLGSATGGVPQNDCILGPVRPLTSRNRSKQRQDDVHECGDEASPVLHLILSLPPETPPSHRTLELAPGLTIQLRRRASELFEVVALAARAAYLPHSHIER
jgi:hypothetical protein